MRNLIFVVIFIAISLSCNENQFVIPNENQNIFPNGGFEFGSLYGWSLEGARDSSIKVIMSPVFEGKYAARLTLFPGDIVSSGHRVELSRPYCAEYLTEMNYNWVFKIDQDFKESDKKYLINQFHDYPDFLNGETWETMIVYPPPVFTSYFNDTIYVHSHSISDGHNVIGKKAIIKGKWVSISYNIKWSLEEDGYIEAYINDQPVTPFNGNDHKYYTPTLYNKMGNFVKFGLYNDPSVLDTNSIYIDNLRISFLK